MRWLGTSFKMTKTRAEAAAYAARLREAVGDGLEGVCPFVIPSATAIATVTDALGGRDSPVLVGAQNTHWADEGAWTGEISVPQAADAGARIIEIGHSERRAHFGESDATVRLKTRAVLRHGLAPLVCVGESEETRAAGGGTDAVLAQAAAALDGLQNPTDVLIAYEPVWAIGEHGRAPRPEEIAPVLAELSDLPVKGVLYGGSVSEGNAAELLRLPGVDGLFVGRAAWDAEAYVRLLATVARHARAVA
ncbi:triose-phosphate isomerase [Streptomyces sp. NPDC056486]|uniref:triose-phosphate isomerase n=1 Tax=Streptomyces sp. NPDC056486 TaxID=3345835 RepID=UPI0036B30035